MQEEPRTQEPPRRSPGEPEPSTYAGGVRNPTTRSLDEMVSRGTNPAGLGDLEPITDSGRTDERSSTGTAAEPNPDARADWEE